MPNDSSSVSVSTSSIHNPLINNPIVQDPISSLDPASIAKAAVGKGVTHQYQPSSSNASKVSNNVLNNNLINNGIPTDSSNRFTFLDPSQLGMGIESCLSELKNNFRNSLNEAAKADEAKNTDSNENGSLSYFPQFSSLTRESSLVDLAIIPSLHTTQSQANLFSSAMNDKTLESEYGMTFIDFPNDGVDPNSMPPCDD
jgi:hypothetical protein